MSRTWEFAKLAWQLTLATAVARQLCAFSVERTTAYQLLVWTSFVCQHAAVGLTAAALAGDLCTDRERGLARRSGGTLALLYLLVFWIAIQVCHLMLPHASFGAFLSGIVWMLWAMLAAPALALCALVIDRDRKRAGIALAICGAVYLLGRAFAS